MRGSLLAYYAAEWSKKIRRAVIDQMPAGNKMSDLDPTPPRGRPRKMNNDDALDVAMTAYWQGDPRWRVGQCDLPDGRNLEAIALPRVRQ
jgi:hypothetical protein